MGNFTARGSGWRCSCWSRSRSAWPCGSTPERPRRRGSRSHAAPVGSADLNPKAWFEPFGSGLVPVLIAVLWSVQVLVIPAAYGKPAPVDPSYLRRTRDLVLVSLAGPVANPRR